MHALLWGMFVELSHVQITHPLIFMNLRIDDVMHPSILARTSDECKITQNIDLRRNGWTGDSIHSDRVAFHQKEPRK
jgi:hypothetical protein